MEGAAVIRRLVKTPSVRPATREPRGAPCTNGQGRQPKSPGISIEEWDRHWNDIVFLYVHQDWYLAQVQSFMTMPPRRFYATISQYNVMFDERSIKKTIKDWELVKICLLDEQRREAGKINSFYRLRGVPVKEAALKRCREDLELLTHRKQESSVSNFGGVIDRSLARSKLTCITLERDGRVPLDQFAHHKDVINQAISIEPGQQDPTAFMAKFTPSDWSFAGLCNEANLAVNDATETLISTVDNGDNDADSITTEIDTSGNIVFDTCVDNMDFENAQVFAEMQSPPDQWRLDQLMLPSAGTTTQFRPAYDSNTLSLDGNDFANGSAPSDRPINCEEPSLAPGLDLRHGGSDSYAEKVYAHSLMSNSGLDETLLATPDDPFLDLPFKGTGDNWRINAPPLAEKLIGHSVMPDGNHDQNRPLLPWHCFGIEELFGLVTVTMADMDGLEVDSDNESE